MSDLDHTAYINSWRDERYGSHQMLRAYAQDLRTFAEYTAQVYLVGPFSRVDILALTRPNPLAHVRDQDGVHLLHGRKGAVTELHNVLMTEMRISSIPVSHGCYPSFPDFFVG